MELTEEQAKFLAECEEEFSDRYTEKDISFMALKSKPLSKPPIVDPWGNNFNRHNQRGGGGGGGHYQNRPYGHQQQYGRDRHWRGGGQSWNNRDSRDSRDSYSRRDHDDSRHRDRQYDDRASHRERSYDGRGSHRDRPYADDRGPRRDRLYDDRGQQQRGDHHPRYQPY